MDENTVRVSTEEDTKFEVRNPLPNRGLRAETKFSTEASAKLETEKKQLQSINAGLAAINAELRTRIADLSRANTGLSELLAGRNIGTVSVDSVRQLAEEEGCTLAERRHQCQKYKALGSLVSGISHDLNNVLAAILGMASAREITASDTKDQQAYMVICKACLRGRKFLNSLARYAKPELVSLSPVEIKKLLLGVRRHLDSVMPKCVEIIEAYSEEPLWVNGDSENLDKALLDLCINAFQAMPHGGKLTLRTSIKNPEWMELAVEDTGEGMTPWVLSQVLDPFFTTRPFGEGQGLGLSMAYGVAKAHGGTLDVFSQFGQGTTIKIGIPRILPPIPDERPTF